MKMAEASFLAWQKQFSTEDDYLKYLQQMKWPDGFICPPCGNGHHYEITIAIYTYVRNVKIKH